MNLVDKLNLLSESNLFKIEKQLDSSCYNIYYKDTWNSPLMASINSDGDVSYYITGTINSSQYNSEIDLDDFERLKNFCKIIIKGDKMKLIHRLKLLAKNKSFDIENCGNKCFVISFKNNEFYEPIEAYINQDGEVEYYMVGIYNSGVDFIDINMDSLKMLEEFVNLLKNDKNN